MWMLHHSPTRSSVNATGQSMSWKLLRSIPREYVAAALLGVSPGSCQTRGGVPDRGGAGRPIRPVPSGDRYGGTVHQGPDAALETVQRGCVRLVRDAERDGADLGQPVVLFGRELEVERTEVVLQ